MTTTYLPVATFKHSEPAATPGNDPDPLVFVQEWPKDGRAVLGLSLETTVNTDDTIRMGQGGVFRILMHASTEAPTSTDTVRLFARVNGAGSEYETQLVASNANPQNSSWMDFLDTGADGINAAGDLTVVRDSAVGSGRVDVYVEIWRLGDS